MSVDLFDRDRPNRPTGMARGTADTRRDRRRFVTALGVIGSFGGLGRLGSVVSTPALLLAGGCAAPSRTPATLRVKAFPSFQNLPLYAALDQGFFARAGLAVDLTFTSTSIELRDDLAAGRVDVAHAAVDNAVAMHDVAHQDIVVFMGGDDGLNELFVQPDIATVEQLRGRTLIVDAPNTAYALQARKILRDHGLAAGDYRIEVVGGTFQRVGAMVAEPRYAASMLNPPFSFQARDAGLRSLGSVADLIGPYQGSSAFAMRPWAATHGERLERYIAGYVAALRWSLDPAHRRQAVALLAAGLKVPPPIAERTYVAMTDPRRGVARDARLDLAGFATTLRLRAELEAGTAADSPRPERYVDLSWYERALRRVAADASPSP